MGASVEASSDAKVSAPTCEGVTMRSDAKCIVDNTISGSVDITVDLQYRTMPLVWLRARQSFRFDGVGGVVVATNLKACQKAIGGARRNILLPTVRNSRSYRSGSTSCRCVVVSCPRWRSHCLPDRLRKGIVSLSNGSSPFAYR